MNDQNEQDVEDELDPNGHDVSKSLNAPRKKHGTRVLITFLCSGCAVESQLDYKPRGVALTDMLCEECMNAQEGSERWKLIRDKKFNETRMSQFRVKCHECGGIDMMSRKPRGEHTCDRCKMEQAQPDKSRLKDMQPVETADNLVFVRRKKT
jgi:hypothetical protein